MTEQSTTDTINIESAIENGAAAIVYSQDLDEYKPGISYLKVKNAYLAYAMACELFFDCPAKKFRLHGITGTNGKTTTAFLIEHILTANNLKTGLITTVECRDGDKNTPSAHTTPEAWELQSLFKRIADNDCNDCCNGSFKPRTRPSSALEAQNSILPFLLI